MGSAPKVIQDLQDLEKLCHKVEADLKTDHEVPNGPKDKLVHLVASLKKPMEDLDKLIIETLKTMK